MSSRMRRCCRVGVLGLVPTCAAVAVAAQNAPVTEVARETTADGFPLVSAVHVDGAPEIDGEILADPVWAVVAPVGGFNQNWDGAWQVETRVTDVGWTAEFAIPFRTLRFNAGDVQTWGLNLQRNIRRRNETAYWSPLPRQFNLYRLSLAGQLTGFSFARPCRYVPARPSTPNCPGTGTTSTYREAVSWPISHVSE